MDYSIRPAAVQDVPAIFGLITQMDAIHAEALPFMWRVSRLDEWPDQYFESVLEDADGLMLVAQSNDSIVGVVYGAIEASVPLPFLVLRRCASIRVLVVDAAHRRQGIGNALLDAAQAWAVSKGMNEIELTVGDFNAGASEMYERAGYRTITRRMVKHMNEPSSEAHPGSPEAEGCKI